MSEIPKFGSNESHILAASRYISEIQNDPERRSKLSFPEVLVYIANHANEMRAGAIVKLVRLDDDQQQEIGEVSFKGFEMEEQNWGVRFSNLTDGEEIVLPVGTFDLSTQETGQQEL